MPTDRAATPINHIAVLHGLESMRDAETNKHRAALLDMAIELIRAAHPTVPVPASLTLAQRVQLKALRDTPLTPGYAFGATTHRIHAIKQYREWMHCDLKTAVTAVDAL